MKILMIAAVSISISINSTLADVIGPRVKFLSKTHESNRNHLFKISDHQKIPVSLKFKTPINLNALESILPQCIEVYKISDRTLYSTHVLIANLDMSVFNKNELRKIPGLIEIESLWRPQQMLPLDVSRSQIQTEEVWKIDDNQRHKLTGKGILIADFDSGINLFHPAFYFADGDTIQWSDENSNSEFDPGIDGIDKNKNMNIDADEHLNFIQVVLHLDNPQNYNPSIDWLYNDENGNQERDFGLGKGFSENDPTYGEQLYIVIDDNKNDLLDIGEKLIALGTCKIRKVFQTDGEIITRGIDLIKNEGDFYGHGTPVAGILAGGIPMIHKLAGIAPEAELLMGNNLYIEDPPFIQSMEIQAPWANIEGADIMLYEDGEWIWQYMDGSSALETMINDYAEDGTIQIVPAGNLAGGGMHTSAAIPAEDSIAASLTVVSPSNQNKIWGSFLWLGDSSALQFRLTNPENNSIHLNLQADYQILGNIQIFSNSSRSMRGTNRMDFLILSDSDPLTGTYSFKISNYTSAEIFFHAYLWDDRSGWSGRTRWDAPNDDGTITWPSTADSAISVAAYAPRDPLQGLNTFSGRGRRIDGTQIIDISAPGSTVYSTTQSMTSRYGGYRAFGGTSSAGPHVAGAVALLLQHNQTISHGEIRNALQRSADTENIPTHLPNDDWGHGRIRIYDALNLFITSVESSITTSKPMDFSLSTAPNPFNSHLSIYYTTDISGVVRINIYNILGQKVVVLREEFKNPGSHIINWNGRNRNGAEPNSGVYFIVLEIDNNIDVQKIALIK